MMMKETSRLRSSISQQQQHLPHPGMPEIQTPPSRYQEIQQQQQQVMMMPPSPPVLQQSPKLRHSSGASSVPLVEIPQATTTLSPGRHLKDESSVRMVYQLDGNELIGCSQDLGRQGLNDHHGDWEQGLLVASLMPTTTRAHQAAFVAGPNDDFRQHYDDNDDPYPSYCSNHHQDVSSSRQQMTRHY
jgi:hypothetical protein